MKKHRTKAGQKGGTIVVKLVAKRRDSVRGAIKGKRSNLSLSRTRSENFVIQASYAGHVRSFLKTLAKEKTPGQMLKFVSKEEATVPWREVLGDRIAAAGGEPALMLKSSREIAELTQLELSERLGIAQSNLAAMEAGRRPIGKEMAKRLAEIFNVDYKVFL